jgi:hypothetical protein
MKNSSQARTSFATGMHGIPGKLPATVTVLVTTTPRKTLKGGRLIFGPTQTLKPPLFGRKT